MIEDRLHQSCPTHEISAYIDGEIDAVRETELELHFSVCESCIGELNLQKQFLVALDSGLKDDCDIELPVNFTRQLVANAESTVSGLRRPHERFNALFICAALALFVLFALGAEATRAFAGVSVIFVKIAAVASFIGHFFYSVFLGFAIILRSIAVQFRPDIGMAIAFAAICAAIVMVVSLKMRRLRRA